MKNKLARYSIMALAILTIASLSLWGSLPTPVRAANLVQNPGFESDLTGWSSWGGTVVITTDVHGGSKAAKDGTAAGGYAQGVTVSANTTYTLSAWGKVGASGESGWIGFKKNDSSYDCNLTFTETTYTYKTVNCTTPADASSMSVYFWKNAGTGSYLYVDDISLDLAAAPTATNTSAPTNTPGGVGTFYVDCSAGSNGSGTQASPWNNLTTVNNNTLSAGSYLYLKRGTTCSGQLWPKGSGASGNPIRIGAYGTGALPIVNNGTADALYLNNQQYIEVDSLEFVGGATVTGNSGTLNYFRLTNLSIHNGSHGLTVNAWASGAKVNDVLIDNVVVHDSAAVGIEVYGPCCNQGSGRSSNVTIQNSTAYNTQSDGIVVFDTNNGTIQNSLAYNTGLATSNPQGWHTPNALWTWDTDSFIVQGNEAYGSHSFGVDGGNYDIDYFNTNNTYQYNYGHDADSYCISVFGAGTSSSDATATVNSIIRYNICSYNGRDTSEATKGDILIYTWNGGTVDGIQIYNNTFYWSPVAAGPAFNDMGSSYSGSRPDFFKNNIIYATTAQMINAPSRWSLDYNLYYYTGGTPTWKYNGTNYTSFSSYKSGSGQDAHGLNTDPLLNSPTYHSAGKPSTQFTLQSGSPAINAGVDVGSMGSHDFFGNAIPNGAYDIGANEYTGTVATSTPTNTPVPPTNTPTKTNTPVVTSTFTPTKTNTPTATRTNTPTPTRTNTPTPTNTPVVTNLLTNPGFETGSSSPWYMSGASVVSGNAHSGTYSARITGSTSAGTGIAMIGVTVSPSTNYRYTGWCKLANTSQSGYLYAKNFGGTNSSVSITSTTYTQYTIDFTTGASNTTAEVGTWRNAGSGTSYIYCDDFSLTTR